MTRPKVSVVMATYNQASTLAKALESLKAQALPAAEFEIIVVNDGSTDETPGVLRRFDGLKTLHAAHRGLVPSCNEGLAAAQGEYLARMDSDDEVDPRWLAALLPALERSPASCCAYPDRYEISGKTKQRVHVRPGNLYNLIACGTLFRTDKLRSVGGFRPFFWEEFDLYLRLKPLGTFLHVPEPLYFYRMNPEGMTQSSSRRREGWKELTNVWGLEALRAAGSHPEMKHV